MHRPDLSDMQPLVLLKPQYETVNGVRRKMFPNIEEAAKDEDNLFYGSFKTFGGTERAVNGVYSVEDTANIETWYRPDIEADCAVGLPDSGKLYEIIGEPENLSMRNQFLKFKVRRIKGGA